MNACELVLFYTDHIPREAPATSDALEKHADSLSPPPNPDDPAYFALVASRGKDLHTTPEWPHKGSILLNDLVMRYRKGTPVKQCRFLLLDEATSSGDFETDRETQKTLRTSFAGCTVLTIAHRINTNMDSDKILVMKDGKASDFALRLAFFLYFLVLTIRTRQTIREKYGILQKQCGGLGDCW